MSKLKAIQKLLCAKQWIVITRRQEPYSNIFYSDRYELPSIAPAHHYADLVFKNKHAVIRWLRCWADVLEKRLYNFDTYKQDENQTDN